jgi:hypothetical protein
VFEINVDSDDYLALVGLWTCLWARTRICCRRSECPIVVRSSGPLAMRRPSSARTWRGKRRLSRQYVTPTILDAKRANAAHQYSQKNRVILKYRRGVENLTMFHDGSLGNLDDGKSQGGGIACLTNKTGHSVASWIFWESRTIKRVCRSSSASEVLSAVEGYDATMWLLALWKEISGVMRC